MFQIAYLKLWFSSPLIFYGSNNFFPKSLLCVLNQPTLFFYNLRRLRLNLSLKSDLKIVIRDPVMQSAIRADVLLTLILLWRRSSVTRRRILMCLRRIVKILVLRAKCSLSHMNLMILLTQLLTGSQTKHRHANVFHYIVIPEGVIQCHF